MVVHRDDPVFPFYWIFYHGGTEGRSIQDQYDRALAENTRRQFGGMDDVRPDRDSLARLVTDEDRLKVGRIVFRTHCIACHGKNGEGKIGVNLTDDVYKNVRNIEDIVTVIANGAGGNAMPSWSAKLHEKEIVLVSAYVASLRDTNVEGGRIAEGRQIDPWPRTSAGRRGRAQPRYRARVMTSQPSDANDQPLPVVHSCGGNGGCGSKCQNDGCSSESDPSDHPFSETGPSEAISDDSPAASHEEASPHETSPGDALLEAPEHVLSTLEKDGSRRWMRPRLSTGSLWQRRRVVAYLLIAVFVAIPHLRLNGKPLILIDILGREFTFFGRTFLPTDTLLLAFLILSVFITIVLVTALTGRAWCGWACPQTVYMEFLFRPIDRLFDGTIGKGGKAKAEQTLTRQLARFGIYLVLCMFLAHTFLAYFVGTEDLAVWIRSSPIEHPFAFLVMAATTGLMLFDFGFFREQLCVIACPYGRFQSVMLDEQSMIVAYDPTRGEPRRKGKRPVSDQAPAGDCVDCNQCVVVCPTGIDIRNGLQMECINCTQCIDACDSVMDRVGLPKGLIRFSSQDGIAGKPKRLLRARTVIYPLILCATVGGLIFTIARKSTFDARILRSRGSSWTVAGGSTILNSFRLKLVNRTEQQQTYSLSVESPSGVVIEVVDPAMMTIESGETARAPIHLRFDRSKTFGDGNEPIELVVSDGEDNQRTVRFHILGPRR